jgi:hypothetical protein
MSRKLKLSLVAMAVAAPLALLATMGSTVASAGSAGPAVADPATFTGNISCNLQGTATITPAATNTGKGPWTVTFTGKNNKCVGLGATSLTQGSPQETLTGSTDSFSFTFINPAGALGGLCLALETGGTIATPIVTTINWLGTSPITPTTVSYPNGGQILPGLILLKNGGVPATSSFAGTADIFLGYNLATVWTDCALATGLSTLKLKHLGGDNLLAGTSF